ncbi:hypothetical protein Srot_0857 [Segniliparus rotundus DSM 44985]|uniref:Uncharacterized protein n=1 Tax=Segniliparus rotundus (strain ATCC BAA-972 / CDC 1076 / CIP 108378 / DSM 44985 / JCM 13578) TaxID=640132 RepID=D6ZE54_SEGRD|nr:hypothetical protein [Segniliparus rotundus]ADG97334.1 hypothetical protein Srot_0857 [Segniliparus rotundus DSM 44985]
MSVLTTSRPVPRDSRGRLLVLPPHAEKPVVYQRASRFVAALSDAYPWSMRQRRQVASGLAARPDLVFEAAAADPRNRAELDKICDRAIEAADPNMTAVRGAALRKLVSRIDLGKHSGRVPEAHRADLEAYVRRTALFQILAVQQLRVQDELRVAGSADRVIRWDDGCYVATVHTGILEHDLLRIVMKLALFANSVPYDPETGARTPDDGLIDQDNALIIHLPPGEGLCNLYWADIRSAREACRLAAQVWEWRHRKVNDLVAPLGL